MKKLIIVLGLTALTGASAVAQEVKVIPAIGGSMIPLQTDQVGPGFGAGLHGGASIQTQLANNLWLTSGMYISQKQNYQRDEEVNSFTETLQMLLQLGGVEGVPIDSLAQAGGISLDERVTTTTLTTTYNLELPLLATYQVKKWRFHVGGYGGVALAARNKVETHTEIPLLKVFDPTALDTTGLLQIFLPEAEQTKTADNNDMENVRRLDAGLLGGVEFQDDRWSFSLYYSHGLTDYRKTPLPDDRLRVNRAFRMMVGYVISVRKEEKKVILE